MREHLFRRGRPKRALLGPWLPLRLPHRAGRGFHVCVRDDVYLQGIAAERAERFMRAVPGDDADRICDRPQRVHDRLQWRAQGAAVEPTRRSCGPGRR